MFYPFNADAARKETANSKKDRDSENAVLLQAYLSIAHVFIHRAARNGHNQTFVYCPYPIKQEFRQALTAAGFVVSAPPRPVVNRFMVTWEES